MRLEGIGQLKNPMASSEFEPADLLACSLVPQPTQIYAYAKLAP
jgi:hypothetical protein